MKTTNNKKSKFLALLLSVMIFSSMGAAFAACADDADSSSSSSSSSTEDTTNDKVDNGTIKNSNFDFTNLTDTVKIGTSVTGWSRAVNSVTTGSAPSSKSASGVVDTKAEKWDDLTTRNKSDEEIAAMEIKDAVAAWDSLTTADKLAFYKDWKAREENKGLDIDDEFEEYKEDSYQSFNIKYEDLPIDTETAVALANPGTPEGAPDSQILMLHNNTGSKDSSGKYSAGTGTAQKYTSSTTVTVKAGTAAQVSVWVKTANLKTVDSNKEEQDAVGKGAYISVTQSVGGKSLDSFEVKNIQTDEWKEYTFYLKGSSFADTKFSLVLGLGQNGGSDHFGYLNGYAFFDNIEYTELTAAEYDAATSGVYSVDLGAEKADKTIDTYSDDTTTFAMDFHTADWTDFAASVSTTAKVTESTDGSTYNTELSDSANDLMKYDAKSAFASSSNKYLASVYDNYLTSDADEPFLQDSDKVLMMLSASGAAYTWEKAYDFTIPADKDYLALSFYVKTSDFGAGTGLTVTLTNGESSTAFSAINTAIIEDVEETNDGWQRYFFFVEKDEDLKGSSTEQSFYLNLNYGATDISVSTAKTSYVPGFAAITKFETLEMDKLEYGCAEAGTYAKLHTLVATEEEKATGNAGFDAAAGTPSDALENGLANAQNYKGVYSDSYYVNPNSTSENGYLINSNANAGLLNKDKFIENYASIIANPDNAAWVNGLGLTASMNAEEVWANTFGNATQPLFIMNDGTNAYGYIGTSTTISSSYTLVSVRVKTTPGAKASVYLVDMDDATRQTMLSVSDNLVYWYDDNGNILTGDPDEKDSKVAFRLDKKTGLYKADGKWANKDAYPGYYANLSAYSKDGDGNLIAAENSATHSYMDKDWDRIVFYAADGKYYADADHTVEVKDLKEVTELAHRYEGGNSADLMIENIDTNGEWKTVTFYIKKGNAAKNYRLEVWSGTRDGNVKNAANSYVLFDANNPGTASDNYSKLMDEYKDDVTDDNKFESVFSYYDTDRHVRYEEAKDVDKVGNLYKDSFTASSYEEAIAYMLYTADGNYTVFADYSLKDVTITPASADTDNDTDDDTDEDTDEDGMNIFMLISSISVAAALLVAIGGIATQRILKVVRKKKAAKARVNVVKKNK